MQIKFFKIAVNDSADEADKLNGFLTAGNRPEDRAPTSLPVFYPNIKRHSECRRPVPWPISSVLND